MRNTYSPEFKAKVVREVLREDKTLSQVAAAHGLHPNLVSQWRDQALAGLTSLFSRTKESEWAAKEAAHEQEKQELYAEIGRLTTQLSWLKKKLAGPLSRAERLTLVERERSEVSVVAQCELLSLNRSGVYSAPRPTDERTLDLQRRIDELYTARPFYGIRKITAQLRADGLVVNHKAVARHMQVMGLRAIYPGPNLSKRAQQHTVYPYLLRGLQIEQPNQVWGVDITYIRLRSGWMYLFAVLDWFSRFVVSWALDLSLEIGFVLEGMQSALATATPTICNSDQGSHFTSSQYIALFHDTPVQISMDGKGRALDNIFTERLWRTVKYEEVYLKDYASPREARTGLGEYLDFYNYRRLHQALDYQTPAQIYFKKGDKSTDKNVVLLS
ncbi:MAG: IS3 family transposase [Chloroflexota bacterium]